MKEDKINKEEFLSLNQTEREGLLKTKQKKFEFNFVNRWKQCSSYHIPFAPTLFVVKQMKSTSIKLDWFGFCIGIVVNDTIK